MANPDPENSVPSDGDDPCPRALICPENDEEEIPIMVASDPALQEVARMVVAGVDRTHELHPRWEEFVEAYGGEERARRHIEDVTQIPGATDVIQTEMDCGGIGLFGGLSQDGDAFVFHEWVGPDDGQMMTRITIQDAREIVGGRKQTVVFSSAL